jgi:hypothetical protein
MSFWVVLGLVITIMLIAIVGMAIRVILVKGAEARGGCAGKNPLLAQEGVACSMCGAAPDEACKEEPVK